DTRHNEYVSQTLGTDISPNRVQYSWPSIANLYFKVGNYSKTEANDLLVAELCILLAKKVKDETEIKKFTDKSLFWVERQSDRRDCLKHRDGSTPSTSLYLDTGNFGNLLVASIQWIDDTVKGLLTIEDTFHIIHY
ncbi:15800_t:CDS:2, partial [Cetraspora pellucida]